MQDSCTSLLYTPSNTPQFSPIVYFPLLTNGVLGKHVFCLEKKIEKHDHI